MSAELPQISVIMAIKAPSPWLPYALASLQNQTERRWELCAVLDGQDDKVIEQLYRLGSKVNLSILPSGSGASACRNRALESARTPLAAVLDSDDLWTVDHLSNHISAFSRSYQLVLRGTAARLIDEQGKRIVGTVSRPNFWLRFQLVWHNCFVHSSTAFRIESALAVGGYPTGISIGEDYDLWMRIATVGNISTSRARTVAYRVHEKQTSKGSFSATELNQIAISRRKLGSEIHLPQFLTDSFSNIWNRRQQK